MYDYNKWKHEYLDGSYSTTYPKLMQGGRGYMGYISEKNVIFYTRTPFISIVDKYIS